MARFIINVKKLSVFLVLAFSIPGAHAEAIASGKMAYVEFLNKLDEDERLVACAPLWHRLAEVFRVGLSEKLASNDSRSNITAQANKYFQTNYRYLALRAMAEDLELIDLLKKAYAISANIGFYELQIFEDLCIKNVNFALESDAYLSAFREVAVDQANYEVRKLFER